MTHHSLRVRAAPGVPEVARPLRDPSRWHRWRQERACRKAIGHCWHPDEMGMIGWFCCTCGGETDGMPKQECVHCLEHPKQDAAPVADERPWTGPEQIRHALATAAGWAWCDEHRRSPWREGGCQDLHPEMTPEPVHASYCSWLLGEDCDCGVDHD